MGRRLHQLVRDRLAAQGLSEAAVQLVLQHLAASTWRTYRAHIAKFFAFVDERARDGVILSVTEMPSDIEFTNYTAFLVKNNVTSGHRQYVSGVRKYFRLIGESSGSLTRLAARGRDRERRHTRPAQVSYVHPDLVLATLVRALTATDPRELQMAVSSVLAFYLMLRGHTLTALRGSDICLEQGPAPALVFQLAAEKQRQTTRVMRALSVPLLDGSSAFLYMALVRWLRCRQDVRLGSPASAPLTTVNSTAMATLFRSVPASDQLLAFPEQTLSDRHLDDAAKFLYTNLDGHDHRRGAYSAALQLGLTEDYVARTYGWTSTAHREYFRRFPCTPSCAVFFAYHLPSDRRPAAAVFDGTSFSFSQ